jgi:hypothetical protein
MSVSIRLSHFAVDQDLLLFLIAHVLPVDDLLFGAFAGYAIAFFIEVAELFAGGTDHCFLASVTCHDLIGSAFMRDGG